MIHVWAQIIARNGTEKFDGLRLKVIDQHFCGVVQVVDLNLIWSFNGHHQPVASHREVLRSPVVLAPDSNDDITTTASAVDPPAA